jgi:hypothetical protein
VDVGRNGGKIATVIVRAHDLLNKAHNGGWLLNKFHHKAYFDRCAEAAPEAFVHVTDVNGNQHAPTAYFYRMLTNPARLPLAWDKMRQGRWKHSEKRLADAKAKKEAASKAEYAAMLADKLENPPTLYTQANVIGAHAHVQYKFADWPTYKKLDTTPSVKALNALLRIINNPTHAQHTTSLAGSMTPYAKLTVTQNPHSKAEFALSIAGHAIGTVLYSDGAL